MEIDHFGEDPTPQQRWEARITAQGPWDEATQPLSTSGAPALPMSVEISDQISLEPFFAHLRSDRGLDSPSGGISGEEPGHNIQLLEFEKGVVYADGRMDLCKMATGPPNIGSLMESLRSNSFCKHFLLGNNIIGPVGAREIAAFIKDRPDQMDTWYLAGNCIEASSFPPLVDAMVASPVITNIWLKRNPLLPASAPAIFRLLILSPRLRTLDLDQTELGDTGVAKLFSLLAGYHRPIALRHIYLNATGISAGACKEISNYLRNPTCRLESLYMSTNPIGNAISYLAPGVKASQTLQRLSLQSCGLKSSSTIPLLEACISHPTLKVLDLGQAYATEDLKMRYNWLDSSILPSLLDLVQHTPLKYLNLSYLPLPSIDILKIYQMATSSRSLLFFSATPLVKGGRSYAEIKAGQAASRALKEVRQRLRENVARDYGDMDYEEFLNGGTKRFLISPRDVRNIDSVYRNRDAGLARRGLKILDKKWKDESETLDRVREAVVGG